MTAAYINQITTAVPDYDIHQKFIACAPSFLKNERDVKIFKRMADRAQIEHRYSCLQPGIADDQLDNNDFYRAGAFPDTARRMEFYKNHAFALAKKALDALFADEQTRQSITHLIVTSCTGFYAPGIDVDIVDHYNLNPAVERTIIGFMGCNAAINALKLARHIVRSNENAVIAVLNIELCTLHLQDSASLEKILSFMIFADGAAASLVSAKTEGIAIKNFYSTLLPESRNQIQWHIGGYGFDMELSGLVPTTINAQLPDNLSQCLFGKDAREIKHWAVHPGGRSVLDAVQESIGLDNDALATSRHILRNYGNMSSATIMFVLRDMVAVKERGSGCAMAFGPGVSVESFLFEII